jgi:hypothetical protein
MFCGDEDSQGHHFDYERPLDVIWVCDRHHDEIHFDGRLIAEPWRPEVSLVI